MIDREHDLPITRQAECCCVSRMQHLLPATRPMPEADLAIMRRLDRLHLEFALRRGRGMLKGLLGADEEPDRPPSCENADAADGDRGAVSPSAHDEAGTRAQDLSVSAARQGDHAPEPGLNTDRSYVPMARGSVYLAVVLDWASRRVLSWRVSITMEAAFCVETLQDALAKHGKPEIFNTDQGSQFTGAAFTGVLADNGIAISMDGKGAWRDNVFVERLWRSVKYEEVYLRAYDSVGDARTSIGRYLDFYNRRRPHSSLDGMTPSIKPTSPRCPPLGSLTQADAPLIDAENLFRQPGPPQYLLHTKLPRWPANPFLSPPIADRPELFREAFGDEQGRCCRLLPNCQKRLIGRRIIPTARFLDAVECNDHKPLRHVAFKCRQLAGGEESAAIRLKRSCYSRSVFSGEGISIVNCHFGHNIGWRCALRPQSRCEACADRQTGN